MLMDCMNLGTMANQIKSFSFYWSKLTKETWIRPKRNMRMSSMQSSVKPLTKHPSLPHPQDQDIIVSRKGPTVLEVLASITGASDKHGPGSIIKEYILGEKEKTKEGESEVQEAGTENRTD